MYAVIIDVRGTWRSDGRRFARKAEARKHRTKIAERWSDCPTALTDGFGRVLHWLDDLDFRREIAAMRKSGRI